MRLTIESRNAREYKLQNCNNQNTANQNVDENAVGYNATEAAEFRALLTGLILISCTGTAGRAGAGVAFEIVGGVDHAEMRKSLREIS